MKIINNHQSVISHQQSVINNQQSVINNQSGYKPQDFSFFHRGGKISTTGQICRFSLKCLENLEKMCNFAACLINQAAMDKMKITREEAIRRWNLAKETKRRMVEKLEALARESYKEQTGEYPVGVEVW